jgi:hypothetical protein
LVQRRTRQQIMSDDYRIEKSRSPVVIKTHSGETITGEMFLQPFARPDGGTERPWDILNGDYPFFPLAMSDGELLLVAKEQVLELETDVGHDEYDERSKLARPAVVEVRLISGETHVGAIFLELPVEHSRLLDFLNRDDERFLTLHGSDHVLLINRRMIERVRPID